MYNDSESRKKATCTLSALKQKEKIFTRHLITFKKMLLEAEDLEWDDAVKKTFLSNSLNAVLMQVLMTTSTSALYNKYIILLHWVSHNLKSIQKAASHECCIKIIFYQQNHPDAMKWKSTKLTHIAAAETEDWQRVQ